MNDASGTATGILANFGTSPKPMMRKIIVTEFITLDGVVEAPGGKAP